MNVGESPRADEEERETSANPHEPKGLEAVLASCARWTPEDALEQPSILCPTDEGVNAGAPRHHPMGLPAMSGDGKRVALWIIEAPVPCCLSAQTLLFELREVSGEIIEQRVLSDVDEEGQDTVSEDVASKHVREINELLWTAKFRPMTPLLQDDHGLNGRFEVGASLRAVLEGRTLTLESSDGERAEGLLEPIVKGQHCCSPSRAEAIPCRLSPDIMGIWRTQKAVVVAAGKNHPADGCSKSPRYYVFELTAPAS